MGLLLHLLIGLLPVLGFLLVLLWLHRQPGDRVWDRLWTPPVRALSVFLAITVLSGLLANLGPVRFALATSRQEWFALAHPAPIAAQTLGSMSPSRCWEKSASTSGQIAPRGDSIAGWPNTGASS